MRIHGIFPFSADLLPAGEPRFGEGRAEEFRETGRKRRDSRLCGCCGAGEWRSAEEGLLRLSRFLAAAGQGSY